MRKLGKQGIFIASIAVMAAILILVSAILTMTAENIPAFRFDLTKTGLFKLDSRTVLFLRSLDKDVVINVLAREDTFANETEYNAQANELMRLFSKTGGRVSLRYVDYVRDPGFAAAYPGLIMKHGDILVSSKEKHYLIKTEELFNYARNPQGQLSIASSKAEEVLYRAILSVAGSRTLRALISAGHGEYTMDDFCQLLLNNNYELSTGTIITGGINPETDIVIIIAPHSDFSDEELQKLDSFLINGGDYGKTILYCADAEQPPLPNLSLFLQEWGVLTEDGAVFETDENRVYNYHPFYAIADYAEDSYGGVFAEIGKPMLMPISRPLSLVFEYRNNYSAKALLSFAASTGVRPPDAGPDFTARDARKRGPMPALVLCAYRILNRETAKTEKASYLLVSGSAGMLDGYAVNSPSFSNADYITNLLNSLSGREEALTLRPKSFGAQGLMLSRAQANTLGAIMIFVIPLLVLAFGVFIWIKRRSA
ncbi:MAG: GldG family protein [Treponema sp.]|jgi:ABC-type uncharacterized transport system involved in gliding motility auxiliary subunit|nr:GldG family protein [Treponema sp.]